MVVSCLRVPGSAVQTCILFIKVVLADATRYTLLHSATRYYSDTGVYQQFAMGIPGSVRLYNPSIDKYIPLSYSTLLIEIIQLCGTARNDTEQTENIKEIYVVETKTRAAPSSEWGG